ncbi:MAG: DUF1152 domain-containing protein [Candidatus Odinarchaeia archaeon]
MIDTYLFNLTKTSKKALIIGIGGGGDILGTLPTRNLLRKLGVESRLASLTYERSKYDPIPGPRGLEEIKNIKKINDTVAIAGENAITKDGLIFQATKMSKFLNEEIFLIDISKGVEGVYNGLKDLQEKYNIDLIIGIDVGGDVVAYGNEPGLRSPLTDSIILSALSKIRGKTVIGVYGICCDGELTLNEISSRFAEIYSNSGFIGAYPLTQEDINILKKGAEIIDTEASRLPLLISENKTGEITIRDGKRKVNLTFFSIFTFYFKTKKVFEISRAARKIINTNSFIEASKLLNEIGITTEYDLQLRRIKKIDR